MCSAGTPTATENDRSPPYPTLRAASNILDQFGLGKTLSALPCPGHVVASEIVDHAHVLDKAVEALPEHIRVGHRCVDYRGLVR